MPVESWTDDVKRRISATQAATHKRRETQVCRVFDLKIVGNKLTRTQRETLARQFLEAKWLRNDCLAHGIDGYVPSNAAQVRMPDGSFETREIACLGSSMKQSVVLQLKTDRANLAKARKADPKRKVGRLRFKSSVACIPLKAHGTDYSLKSKHRVKVQKVPGYLRIRRGGQLPDDAEPANAKLVRRADGYHLLVTAYTPLEDETDAYVPGTVVGIDMGLETAVTLSDGTKVRANVEETKRLKGLQRKLSRQVKGSNNYAKTRKLIEREYQRMDNLKDEAARQLCASVLRNEMVFMQDESIVSWKRKSGYVKGGRSVQHSILGRVKSKLKDHPRVTVLHKTEATTQTCMSCGSKTKHAPGQRTFTCSCCGHRDDRDVHAAQNMVLMGISQIPVERRNALVERISDESYAFDFKSNVASRSAMKQETPLSSVTG